MELSMFDHLDVLSEIDKDVSLSAKMERVHAMLREHLPFIARIAAAIYDNKSDILNTFVDSNIGSEPLAHYQFKLSESSSLVEIVEQGKPRVIDDLYVFKSSEHEHSKRLLEAGYRSSYTMPMYNHGVFFGFIFFDSLETDSFTETALSQIDPYAHIIALAIIHDFSDVQTLMATVQTARDITHFYDEETGAHQDRMSRYARLIAMKLAERYGFSDEYVEKIFIFSPLHDIGKLGIPSEILLKRGRLDLREYEIMKSHTILGRKLIDQILKNFDLDHLEYIDILRNIAVFHHEAVDGSGYPEGLKQEQIPIEARIVAVADVFDALTSRRPYKLAWSNASAFSLLRQMGGVKFDMDCVNVLIDSEKEVLEIQSHFLENPIG